MNIFRNTQRQIESGSRTVHQGSSEPPYFLNFEIAAIERIIEVISLLSRTWKKEENTNFTIR